MKIYTKTGDAGTTGLFGGPRISKDAKRICSYGEIDELNAVLGVVRVQKIDSQIDSMLKTVQDSLFSIGAELATPSPEAHDLKWSGQALTETMEVWIDQLESTLPPLRTFVLPGGSPAAAYLHLARTTCRRAEREVVALGHDSSVSDLAEIITYLNRLSDLLFVMARAANQAEGVPDVPWNSPRRTKN